MHVVKVSRKGQIVIPKEVRDRHKLNRGTDLVVQEVGNAIVLRKKRDVERVPHDQSSVLLRASEFSLLELWGNREDDAWNEL